MSSVDPFSISPRGNKENIDFDKDKKTKKPKDVVSKIPKNDLEDTKGYREIKTAYKKTWAELSETEKELKQLLLAKIFGSNKLIEILKSKKQMLLERLQRLNIIIGAMDKSSAKIQLSVNPLDIETLDLPADAIEFLEEEFKSESLRLLLNKYSRIPAVKAAIEGIKENYEKWKNSPNKDDLGALKAYLSMQHYNLGCLCEILDKFKEEKGVLNQIRLTPEILNKFFYGQDDLIVDLIDLKDTSDIENEIKSQLEIIKQVTPNPTTEEEFKQISENTKRQRKYSPITTKALEMQAKLFEAERKGKAWSAGQADLKSRGDSVNLVYQLSGTDAKSAGKTIAFFKEGSGGEKASGTMEKLMWDMAVIMGLEEQFTPTKETEIRTKAKTPGAHEEVISWSKEGDLTLLDKLSKEKKGGLQVAQQGITLSEYLQNPMLRKKPISQEQLIQGTLATVVFGMYDAHEKNIIVDDQGRIKFFDNTRSLPSSNGAIIWGGLMQSSYRSGLLGLEGSFTKLTDAEREQIRLEIEKYASQIAKLEKFFKNPKTVKKLESLPPGWFSSYDTLAALKERVKNLQESIDNPHVKNLRDLVFAANPDFKFFAALKIFIEATRHNAFADSGFQRRYLGNVGYDSLTTMINKIQDWGIDTKFIRDMCVNKNPAYPFEEIIVQMEMEKSAFAQLSVDEFVDALIISKNQADDVINDYYEKAKIDLKDIDRKQIPDHLYKIMVNELKRCKFPIYPVDLTKDTGFVKRIFTTFKKLQVCVINDESSKKLLLCHKTSTGIERIPLDYIKEIGKLVAGTDNQAYSAIELADIFEDELDALKQI